MSKFFLGILLFFGMAANVYAWNAVAHQVIAKIALDNINSCTKNQVDKLFQILTVPYPRQKNLISGAAWLDIDNSRCPYDSIHCMPPPKSWHFIDRPYAIAAQKINTTKSNYSPPNIVWAINQELGFLDSQNATETQRAIALLILDHLLGDITQPLHNSNGYNADFPLPKGDRGGNAYSIEAAVTCINPEGYSYTRHIDNLHAYWDQGAGLFSCQSAQKDVGKFVNEFARKLEYQYAHDATLQHLIDTELTTDTNANAWSLQASAYAPAVYDIAYHSTPSSAYTARAQTLVMQQITLAGYRLAQVLNQAFVKNGRCK